MVLVINNVGKNTFLMLLDSHFAPASSSAWAIITEKSQLGEQMCVFVFAGLRGCGVCQLFTLWRRLSSRAAALECFSHCICAFLRREKHLLRGGGQIRIIFIIPQVQIGGRRVCVCVCVCGVEGTRGPTRVFHLLFSLRLVDSDWFPQGFRSRVLTDLPGSDLSLPPHLLSPLHLILNCRAHYCLSSVAPVSGFCPTCCHRHHHDEIILKVMKFSVFSCTLKIE